MTTSIYYELEDPLIEDLQAARRLAGTGALEIVRQGILWPEDSSCPERLKSERDHEFLNQLMGWIESVRPVLEASEANGSAELEVNRVSFFEIIRYRFLLDVASSEHRWWVIRTILKNWSPSRLIWVSRVKTAQESRELKAFVQSAQEDTRVELLALHHSPLLGTNWAHMKDILWPHVDLINRAARSLLRQSSPAARNGHDRVLFTEYFPNSVKASLPVARALSSKPGIEVLWLAAREKVQAVLSEDAIESLLLDDVASPKAILSARLSKHKKLALADAIHELTLFGEKPSGPSEHEYRGQCLERSLLAALSDAVKWVVGYRQAFERIRPDVVVSTTYSSLPGRAAALVAKDLGIGSVFLQHGLYPDQYVWSFFCNDLKITWGEYERRSLLRNGSDPSSVCVAGAPIYDELFRRFIAEEEVLPASGQPLKLAFMASRTGGLMSGPAVSRATLLAVANTARQLSAQLTVKAHPGDSTSVPEEVMVDYPEFTLLRSGDSQAVICTSDLVIVVSSTTGYEACVAHRPLIVFNLTGSEDLVPFRDYGAAVDVTRVEDLAPTIRRIQEDSALQRRLAQGRQRLIDDMLNGGGADAAENAALAILDFVGQRAALN